MDKPAFIGLYTRYSSWTARVETVLQYFEIAHESKMYNIFTANPAAEQPSAPFKGGLFPVLQPEPTSDPEFLIRDSLAICEYLAEKYPELGLWPKDEKLRAQARSVVAQMHSGFSELRNNFHTNFVAQFIGNVPISAEAVKECKKMVGIWSSTRAETQRRLSQLGQADEGFLFGKFSIADAFFWPVLWRFRTYGLPLTDITEDGLKWVQKMWNDPKMRQIQASYFKQLEDPLTAMGKYDDLFKGVDDIEKGQFQQSWQFSA